MGWGLSVRTGTGRGSSGGFRLEVGQGSVSPDPSPLPVEPPRQDAGQTGFSSIPWGLVLAGVAVFLVLR